MPVLRLRQAIALSLLGSVVLAACSTAPIAPHVLVTREAVAFPLSRGEGGLSSRSPEVAQPQGTPNAIPAQAVVEPGEDEALLHTPPKSAASGEAPVATATAVPPVPHSLRDTQNILLLGTDQSSLEYVGRTDSIMVLALDADNRRAALVSFTRDMYLPIPGVGYNRINTAYAYGEERKPGGGIPLLMSTLERNFDLLIHGYVRIDFSGFREVVDAVGGVDIEVDCPIYDEKNPEFFDSYILEPGQYHMDGLQALYYARSRKSTSDFDRSRRQMQVLMAIRQRMLEGETNVLASVPALWGAYRNAVDTDLSLADVLDLAPLGVSITPDRVYSLVIRPPLVEGWVTPQGAQVQLPDLPAIREALLYIWDQEPLSRSLAQREVCPGLLMPGGPSSQSSDLAPPSNQDTSP